MRMVNAALLGVALLSTTAVAADADDQSRLALAREVVNETHAVDHARRLMPIILNQMKPMLAKRGADQKIIDELFDRLQTKLDGEVATFMDLTAQVYAKEFSEDDLTNLLAFYKTPTGQNLIAKQPVIAQGMMTVGIQWGQMLAREVVREYEKDKAAKTQEP